MDERDCKKCATSKRINDNPVIVSCPFLKDIAGGVVGAIARICKHYSERVETCGTAQPCPTCEKAKELCKDWSECTAEHYALKIGRLRELFTAKEGG